MSTSTESLEQAVFNLRAGPRRLFRVAQFARQLGCDGVEYVDAVDFIDDAIWGNGILPADTPRQQKVWRAAKDATFEAWYDGNRERGRAKARAAVAEHILAMRTPYNPFDDQPGDTTEFLELQLTKSHAAHLIETAAMAANIPEEDLLTVVGEVCPLPRHAITIAEMARQDFQLAPARRRAIQREIAEGTYRELTREQEHTEFLEECIEPIERRGGKLPPELAELAAQSRAYLAEQARVATLTPDQRQAEATERRREIIERFQTRSRADGSAAMPQKQSSDDEHVDVGSVGHAAHELYEDMRNGELIPRVIAPTPFVLRDPRQIPRRQWLYGTHLIRGEVSLTLAPGGVGKTSLGMAEALAMASGRKLLHDELPRPLRVWVFNGEEPAEEMERRLAAAALHYRIGQADIGDRLFTDNGNELPLVIAKQTKNGVEVRHPLVEKLVSALHARQIDVLLVDPFVSTHSVHENDNAAIQQAASAWKAVAYRAGVAVGLAHHTRKANGREITAEDSRGGDALVSKVRDARALNPMSEADAAAFGIHKHDRDSYFWTGPGGKSNMSAKTRHKTWFQLVSVGLGNGEGLSAPQDHVAVVTPWSPPRPVEDLCPAAVARLADAMGEAEWRADWRARNNPLWIGAAVADAFELGQDEGWKDAARPVIAALEGRRIIVKGYGITENRKPALVYRLGNRETAEI